MSNENTRDQQPRTKEAANMSDENERAVASTGSVSIGEAQSTGYDEWWCPWYLCPKCEKSSIARSFSYCPNCGVKLEWQPHAIPKP